MLLIAPTGVGAEECKSCWSARCADFASYLPACEAPEKPRRKPECLSCWSAKCAGFASYYPPCDEKAPAPAPRPEKRRAPSDCAAAQGLELKVDMPTVIRENDAVEARIDATCPAHLVVYFLEQDGAGSLLWPSEIEPDPMGAPGHPAQLLSPRERAARHELRAMLRRPGVPAYEMFVVYGFTRKSDFQRMRPTTPAAGAAYAASLEKRLAELPRERWARAAVSYVIQPRPVESR
jgi:hypothetical protein